MQKYANWSGTSGIVGFEATSDSITVQFRDGWKYLYNISSSGSAHITAMQKLAESGSGLNSYISKYVKAQYAKKFR
jgi:hypothetical protein